MAWTRVAALADLKERGVMDAEVDGDEIALYWVEATPYATENICTHAFARLSEGFLDGDCIECPVHQALFNEEAGGALSPPPLSAGEDISLPRRGRGHSDRQVIPKMQMAAAVPRPSR